MKKVYLINKLLTFGKVFFVWLMISLNSHADNLDINKKLVVLGQADAVVKIKIFSSFTCPHCADFHFNVIPKIKKNYVDNGNVQIIFIDFPLDQAAFNASKLLHCTEKNKQMKLMDIIYEKQKQWTNETNIENINENLKEIVKSLGISSSQFEKCLIDEDISDKILNGRIDAARKYSINATPTIIINEKKLEGSVSFKNIKKRIEKII